MFQRSGAPALKKGLAGINNFLALLANPQRDFKSIHIGGTNGKGSQAHLLSAVLQYLGYKVGLYTSPHLTCFRERIKINGTKITEAAVNNFINEHRTYIEVEKPSFFEITVALAFWYFKLERVDWAVVEVGLGGRLDSTNILKPKLAIITNISYDHCEFLGNTLAAIAGEKAGIIKRRTPIIIGERHPQTEPIFEKRASEQKSELYFSEDHYEIIEDSSTQVQVLDRAKKPQTSFFQIPLKGNHQKANLRNVYMAFELLKRKRYIEAKKGDFEAALANFERLNPIYGRWQTLAHEPLTIADVGHNEAGIKTVRENLKHLDYNRLHIVIGFSNNKDIRQLLEILPAEANYYISHAKIPRAAKGQDILNIAKALNLTAKTYSTIPIAFEAARTAAQKDDCIFVGGSLFVVGEVFKMLNINSKTETQS